MPDIAQLFLAHSVKKIQQTTGAIQLCLEKLSEDQILARGSSNENTVANLVLHLCGNLKHYIGHVVAGDPDTRDRESEFTLITLTKFALQNKLDDCTGEVVIQLLLVSESRLLENVMTKEGERTVLEVIYQVVGHFQQHAGQIIFATKHLTGDDLQIYRPLEASPSTSEETS